MQSQMLFRGIYLCKKMNYHTTKIDAYENCGLKNQKMDTL